MDEHNFLHPDQPAQVPFLSQKLAGATGPFIATSDYDHLVPDQIRQWIPGDYHVLGADGLVSLTLALLPVVSSRSTPPVWSPRPWRLWLSRVRLTVPW